MQVARFVSRSALFNASRISMCARSMTTAAATPAKVPLNVIQDLRNRTGAGVSDCKKALELNQCDIANATAWLREKGKLTATKLSNRVAGEGVVAVASNGRNGIMIELNSETDFVSRGASFRTLAHKIVDQAVALPHFIPQNAIDPISMETLQKMQVEVDHDEPGKPPVRIPVEEAITRTVTKTKENIKVRRAYGISLDGNKGAVGGYVHGGEGDAKAGRLGALVALASEAKDKTALAKIATEIAMHVVGMNPKCIDSDSKGENSEDSVLLNQGYFSGNGETVKETLDKAAKELGAPIRVHAFMRLQVGEGIEKKKDDFANEVMGMLKQ